MSRDELRRQIAIAEGGIIAIKRIAEHKGWLSVESALRLAELKTRAEELRTELQRITTEELST